MSESRRIAGQPNHGLTERMAKAKMSNARLARAAGVNPKTVERWLDGRSLPQLSNAVAAAEALDCEPQDIWPDRFPVMNPPSEGTVAVSVYASRAEVPLAVWNQHFATASDHIDVCVYGGTFLFDAVPDFEGLLMRAVARGATVRFLVGDPEGATIALRGEEEGIGESLADRCRMTLRRLRRIAPKVPVEVRLHDTTLYVSMFRADGTLIANHHIHGLPASDNPSFVIDREASPAMWAKYEASFDSIWADARPDARVTPAAQTPAQVIYEGNP